MCYVGRLLNQIEERFVVICFGTEEKEAKEKTIHAKFYGKKLQQSNL